MHCHVVCIAVLQSCGSNFMELHVHAWSTMYVVWVFSFLAYIWYVVYAVLYL